MTTTPEYDALVAKLMAESAAQRDAKESYKGSPLGGPQMQPTMPNDFLEKHPEFKGNTLIDHSPQPKRKPGRPKGSRNRPKVSK